MTYQTEPFMSLKNFVLLALLAGEKKIVKLLHFPNITPTEQRRLLMSESDSGSGSDDEHEQMPSGNHDGSHKPPPRKKSSTKRSLDMQRKISLSKLRDEKKEKDSNLNNNNTNESHSSPESSTPSSSPSINSHSLPLKAKSHRFTGVRNGKISDGYDQYLKQYLLQVPMPKDYGEPSSDDLSSEWDSDHTDNKGSEANNKESKVSNCSLSDWTGIVGSSRGITRRSHLNEPAISVHFSLDHNADRFSNLLELRLNRREAIWL